MVLLRSPATHCSAAVAAYSVVDAYGVRLNGDWLGFTQTERTVALARDWVDLEFSCFVVSRHLAQIQSCSVRAAPFGTGRNGRVTPPLPPPGSLAAARSSFMRVRTTARR